MCNEPPSQHIFNHAKSHQMLIMYPSSMSSSSSTIQLLNVRKLKGNEWKMIMLSAPYYTKDEHKLISKQPCACPRELGHSQTMESHATSSGKKVHSFHN